MACPPLSCARFSKSRRVPSGAGKPKNAPRAVRLALWVASLEGASNRELEAHNRAIQALGLERCLTAETKRLRQVVALLLRVGTFGSANEPLWRIHLDPVRPKIDG